MTDEKLHQVARFLFREATKWAEMDSNPCDTSATAAAILVAAVEYATPDLSPENRVRLFKGEEE